jgi:hypothetical protein
MLVVFRSMLTSMLNVQCVLSALPIQFQIPNLFFVLGPEITSFKIMQCRRQLTAISSVATNSPLYPVSPCLSYVLQTMK